MKKLFLVLTLALILLGPSICENFFKKKDPVSVKEEAIALKSEPPAVMPEPAPLAPEPVVPSETTVKKDPLPVQAPIANVEAPAKPQEPVKKEPEKARVFVIRNGHLVPEDEEEPAPVAVEKEPVVEVQKESPVENKEPEVNQAVAALQKEGALISDEKKPEEPVVEPEDFQGKKFVAVREEKFFPSVFEVQLQGIVLLGKDEPLLTPGELAKVSGIQTRGLDLPTGTDVLAYLLDPFFQGALTEKQSFDDIKTTVHRYFQDYGEPSLLVSVPNQVMYLLEEEKIEPPEPIPSKKYRLKIRHNRVYLEDSEP